MIPCFVELCAGSAAVSLALLGWGAEPPVTFMGGKRSLARAILGVAGLRRGEGAERVLLADAGPWGLAWRVLSDDRGRAAVCAQLLAWSEEDPRELWDWLVTLPPEALGVAGWLWLQGRATNGTPVWWQDAEGWRQCMGGRTSHAAACQRGEVGGGGLRFPRTIADRLASLPFRGRWVRGEHPSKSPRPQAAAQAGTGRGRLNGLLYPATVADRVDELPASALLAVHHGDVRDVDVEGLPEGSVILLDPPYLGCTGYSHQLPRAEVLELARRCDRAGHLVVVCEAVPLTDLPWHYVEITHCRDGQRTGKTEWLTVNREPRWRPSRTLDLWAPSPTSPGSPAPPGVARD